jgi:transcriptional regulator with XRE-family HTH domain
VPNRIRAIRLQLQERYPYAFAAEEVARRVGVHAATLRGWELDQHRPPRRHAERLARDLGVDLEALQLD